MSPRPAAPTRCRRPRGAFVDPLLTAGKGVALLAASTRRRLLGVRRYDGSAEEICAQIVDHCFDRTRCYFRTSTLSYPEFWARDFGRVVPALLALGREREVAETYRYALARYARAGHFALVITRGGRLFDFPAYAPDGFALFLFGLAELGDRRLVERHRGWLVAETERFVALVIDPRTGLVRRGLCFSEAQDYALRDSSCYSNAHCYLLQVALTRLGLPNPLAEIDYPALLEARLWAGDHFVDDLRRPSYPSGDAQVAPFWVGACGRGAEARQRLERVRVWMDEQGLNDPLPCRYGVGGAAERRMAPLHRFDPWQRETVWTCLGLQWLEVLHAFAHPRLEHELAGYRRMVERLGCFPELLDAATGELYRGPIITAECTMLWAASLWRLLVDAARATPPADDRSATPPVQEAQP